MQKNFRYILPTIPTLLTLQLLGINSIATAGEVKKNNDIGNQPKIQKNLAIPTYSSTKNPLETTSENEENIEDNLISRSADGKVTSVSELSDVQPTDWAFQALQSLVERYGCIAGYPDGTFRGNRALTRYEFAAGLNACMDKISELIGANAGGVKKEDLNKLQKLQEQFATELATLRGRVDKLEARTAQLESQQFSTTTKLYGLAFFNLTGATASDRVQREPGRRIGSVPVVEKVGDPSTTLSGLAWLTLKSSFTGKDTLTTQLAVGNGTSPANVFTSAGQFNTTGVPYFDQTAGANINEVILRELSYKFPIGDKVQVTVGPRINWYANFDFNAFTYPVNGTSSFNSINGTFLAATKRGAGAVVAWLPTKQIEFRAGYLGESLEFTNNNSSANPNTGLFKGTNTITAELTFKPSQKSNLRFLYQRSNLNRNSDGQISYLPIFGVADDGFGGRLRDANSDTYSFNFDWLVSKGIGVFGRYEYASTQLRPVTAGRAKGEVNAQNIQAGLAFPNLGKQGALATVSFVIPFDVLDGRRYLAAGGGNGGTQYDLEASYFFPVTDNISIAPAFYYIKNINNFDNNPDVYVGHIRTQFQF